MDEISRMLQKMGVGLGGNLAESEPNKEREANKTFHFSLDRGTRIRLNALIRRTGLRGRDLIAHMLDAVARDRLVVGDPGDVIRVVNPSTLIDEGGVVLGDVYRPLPVGEMHPPLWYYEVDGSRPVGFWTGPEEARTRPVLFPVGAHVWSVAGWVSHPWWIPRGGIPVVLDEIKKWEMGGFRGIVSTPLGVDWAGNGCLLHANRRGEPALTGDVQVWLVVTDVDKALETVNLDYPVPCYLHVDAELYNSSDTYRNVVHKYSHRYDMDYESSMHNKNRPRYFL